jgi:hypothetical protein
MQVHRLIAPIIIAACCIAAGVIFTVDTLRLPQHWPAGIVAGLGLFSVAAAVRAIGLRLRSKRP